MENDTVALVEGAESPRKRWFKALATIALSFHALATLSVLVPDSRIKQLITPVFRDYQILTGTEQHWDMFSTVSQHHAYDVSVEVKRSASDVAALGPVLPGLGEKPDYFRYHTYFTRLDTERYAPFRDAYVDALREAFAAEKITGKSFEIRKSEERLRFLEVIRTTGEISYSAVTPNGPYPMDSPRATGDEENP